MKKLIIAAAIGAATMMSGCATQTAVIQPNAQSVATYSKSQSFFISGLGQEQTVNAAEVCGGAANVAKIQTIQQPVDIALGIVSFGIYTPRTAKVYCR